MACRCGELDLCDNDKGILIKARGVVEGMYTESEGIETKLGELKINSPQAYETDNIGEICTAIEELDDDLVPAIGEWLAKIDEALEALEEIKEAYKEEDRLFHESAGEQNE